MRTTANTRFCFAVSASASRVSRSTPSFSQLESRRRLHTFQSAFIPRTFRRCGLLGVRQSSVLTPGVRSLHCTPISMRLKSGIVGLPNVGKSTLFNALVENSNAAAANFPFCTIEPNIGIAVVPDSRLPILKHINSSDKVIPATLEFVDIAGLVAGASQGEGLGNQFLANIRECDAIVHVVRCFSDADVVHVSGSVDPLRDIDVINLELALADLAQIERRLSRAKSKSRGSSKEESASAIEISALERVASALDTGTPARAADLSEDERVAIAPLGLLTLKPVIYAANVSDADLCTGNDWTKQVEQYASKSGAETVLVSAQVESELVQLESDERREFLAELGVKEDECGLRALVRASYRLLGLRTYFTSGPKETRAWTITQGACAPQAAGVIHSDFERGFIRAETIAFDELKNVGSEKVAREKGLVRSEGKEYVVREGDVMLFRFNV